MREIRNAKVDCKASEFLNFLFSPKPTKKGEYLEFSKYRKGKAKNRSKMEGK